MKNKAIDPRRGKDVRLYIYDKDDPGGIKHYSGSVIKVIVLPRTHLKNDMVKALPNDKATIYFLLGESEEEDKPIAYIGESGRPIKRIIEHSADAGKEFFNTAILFISERRRLGKAHLRFIEQKCIDDAEEAGTFKVENGAPKATPKLDIEDESFASEIHEEIKYHTSILGCSIFERPRDKDLLFLKDRGIEARAMYSGGRMTVLAGSQAVSKERETSSLHKYAKFAANKRDDLQDNGILKKEGNRLVFKEDSSFRTPSGAARVVAGKNINGREAWKNTKGETWGELYGGKDKKQT